ncbi:MAG: 50S ribosomal protein L11 methyltransferase [Candidatus Omnitrophota bacterium]
MIRYSSLSRILSIVIAAIFITNNIAYGVDLSTKSCLRPWMQSDKDDFKEIDEGLEKFDISSKSENPSENIETELVRETSISSRGTSSIKQEVVTDIVYIDEKTGKKVVKVLDLAPLVDFSMAKGVLEEYNEYKATGIVRGSFLSGFVIEIRRYLEEEELTVPEMIQRLEIEEDTSKVLCLLVALELKGATFNVISKKYPSGSPEIGDDLVYEADKLIKAQKYNEAFEAIIEALIQPARVENIAGAIELLKKLKTYYVNDRNKLGVLKKALEVIQNNIDIEDGKVIFNKKHQNYLNQTKWKAKLKSILRNEYDINSSNKYPFASSCIRELKKRARELQGRPNTATALMKGEYADSALYSSCIKLGVACIIYNANIDEGKKLLENIAMLLPNEIGGTTKEAVLRTIENSLIKLQGFPEEYNEVVSIIKEAMNEVDMLGSEDTVKIGNELCASSGEGVEDINDAKGKGKFETILGNKITQLFLKLQVIARDPEAEFSADNLNIIKQSIFNTFLLIRMDKEEKNPDSQTETSDNNISYTFPKAYWLRAESDDGNYIFTITLDSKGVIEDIVKFGEEFGLKILFSGGTARNMILGKNPVPSDKNNDIDISIQVPDNADRLFTDKIELFKKRLSMRYPDIRVDILDLEEAYEEQEKRRTVTLNRLLICKENNNWKVGYIAKSGGIQYLNDAKEKILSLTPELNEKGEKRIFDYVEILRFVILMAQFPDIEVDQKSLEEIKDFVNTGFINDSSNISIEETFKAFLKLDFDWFNEHKIRFVNFNNRILPLPRFLRLFILSSSSDKIIDLLKSIGGKERNLYTIYSNIINIEKAVDIVSSNDYISNMSDFDDAVFDVLPYLENNMYARQYRGKEIIDFYRNEYINIEVPAESVQSLLDFIEIECKNWFEATNDSPISRRIHQRYESVFNIYHLLNVKITEGCYKLYKEYFSERFYNHIVANKDKINSMIGSDKKYKNLLEYYFGEEVHYLNAISGNGSGNSTFVFDFYTNKESMDPNAFNFNETESESSNPGSEGSIEPKNKYMESRRAGNFARIVVAPTKYSKDNILEGKDLYYQEVGSPFKKGLLYVKEVLPPHNIIAPGFIDILNGKGGFLKISPSTKVLDIGTGCGVLACAAALNGANNVKAIDIEPLAVAVTKLNIESLGLGKKVKAYEGDLFKSSGIPKGEKFDLITASLPLESDVEDLAPRFIEELPRFLAPGGKAFIFIKGDMVEGDAMAWRNIKEHNGSYGLNALDKTPYEELMERSGLSYKRIDYFNFASRGLVEASEMYYMYMVESVDQKSIPKNIPLAKNSMGAKYSLAKKYNRARTTVYLKDSKYDDQSKEEKEPGSGFTNSHVYKLVNETIPGMGRGDDIPLAKGLLVSLQEDVRAVENKRMSPNEFLCSWNKLDKDLSVSMEDILYIKDKVKDLMWSFNLLLTGNNYTTEGYPNKESVKAELKRRSSLGWKNYIVNLKSGKHANKYLYDSALKLGIELPKEPGSKRKKPVKTIENIYFAKDKEENSLEPSEQKTYSGSYIKGAKESISNFESLYNLNEEKPAEKKRLSAVSQDPDVTSKTIEEGLPDDRMKLNIIMANNKGKAQLLDKESNIVLAYRSFDIDFDNEVINAGSIITNKTYLLDKSEDAINAIFNIMDRYMFRYLGWEGPYGRYTFKIKGVSPDEADRLQKLGINLSLEDSMSGRLIERREIDNKQTCNILIKLSDIDIDLFMLDSYEPKDTGSETNTQGLEQNDAFQEESRGHLSVPYTETTDTDYKTIPYTRSAEKIGLINAYRGQAKIEKTIFVGKFAKYSNVEGNKLKNIVRELKTGGLTAEEEHEIELWEDIIARIEQDKIDYLSSRTGIWEGFECDIFAERALKILNDSGITDVEMVTYKGLSPTDKRYNTYSHVFCKVNICGKDFVIDTSADQFEIKKISPTSYHPYTYHYLGVTLVPLDIINENPDTFWMYKNQPAKTVSLAKENIGAKLKNIKLKEYPGSENITASPNIIEIKRSDPDEFGSFVIKYEVNPGFSLSSHDKTMINLIDYGNPVNRGKYQKVGEELWRTFDFGSSIDVSPLTHTGIVGLELFDLKGKTVLDLGTGDGVLAIAAAKLGAKVIAVDHIENAIELAGDNAKNNSVDKQIDFINRAFYPYFYPGELDFSGLGHIDLIVMNVPETLRNNFLEYFIKNKGFGLDLEGMILAGSLGHDRNLDSENNEYTIGLKREMNLDLDTIIHISDKSYPSLQPIAHVFRKSPSSLTTVPGSEDKASQQQQKLPAQFQAIISLAGIDPEISKALAKAKLWGVDETSDTLSIENITSVAVKGSYVKDNIDKIQDFLDRGKTIDILVTEEEKTDIKDILLAQGMLNDDRISILIVDSDELTAILGDNDYLDFRSLITATKDINTLKDSIIALSKAK